MAGGGAAEALIRSTTSGGGRQLMLLLLVALLVLTTLPAHEGRPITASSVARFLQELDPGNCTYTPRVAPCPPPLH
ncbi:hypothetical protein BS78_08G076700 [Paspalum vaginatum]|nr:hypothetical protein BS78_08G076700 [Paspalum vaginatum]